MSIGIQEFQGSLDDIIDTTVKDIYLALANKSAELKPEPEMPKQQEAINPETHSKERKIARILLSLVGGNMPGKDAYDHIIDLVD